MKSVRKAGLLLDHLAREQECTTMRLAALTDEPRSSVYRLLDTLLELELVEPGSRRGTYRLGFGLLRLGSAVLARFDERQAALPAMERLQELTGQSAMLMIARGREAVCIERIEGTGVNALAMRLGTALPLHVGGGPRALLAHQPRSAQERYVREAPLDAFTAATIVDAQSLLAALETTRRTGLAISDEDVTVGIASIGAPVFGYGGELRAALSIGGAKTTVLGPDRAAHEAAVRDAARDASRALGFDIG